MPEIYGPRSELGQTIHAMKYRAPDESFDDYCVRYARTTAGDNAKEFRRLLHYLRDQTILPAGRQQLSVGRPFQATSFNCFVMSTIPDNTRGIFEAVADAAMTMRAGGGIGMDFSSLRPSGEPIRGLGMGALASGPISFMDVWNSMCGTIMSAGSRRGAMMGTLRIDHPDILHFIKAKQNGDRLTNFNISVTVTDAFMEALANDGSYDLRFGETTFGQARAADVWAMIMESNFDWAEPGIQFLDRVNQLNPLNYCETIATSNPCSEQFLPPWGCCLLGSINMVKLVQPVHESNGIQIAAQSGKQVVRYEIDLERLDDAVDASVRAYDAVIDRTLYPLEQQKQEEMAKRRMGVGVTGLANALEICGQPYGSPGYLDMQDTILQRLLNRSYRTSMELAKEKSTFPLWDADRYCAGEFFKTRLDENLQDEIRRYGLRNGLLTSIAPTGTISQGADYVSSGLEPVLMLEGDRTVITPQGPRAFHFRDYAKEFYGVTGKTADQVTAEEHVDVLCRAQRYVDNAISKTVNVNGQIKGEGPGVPFSAFKQLYLRAWEGGAKSCATYNLNGKRGSIFSAAPKAEPEGAACFYDPETGTKACEN
jgi:ribonucleoside-diphosphate reductase alpha chain